jgi:RHS repeat-associated protein
VLRPRSSTVLPFAVAALLAATAQAQVVQPLETTSTQAISADSAAAQSIPLPLAAERTGAPIPLALVHTGSARSGIAGLGWDMPLSVVVESAAVGRRLPRPDGSVPLMPVVSLGGASVPMVPASSDGKRFVARDRAQNIELVKEDASTWVMRQSEYEYVFAKLSGNNSDTYHLVQIGHMPSDARIDLDYQVAVYGSDHQVQVTLSKLEYNHIPGGTCPASRVTFTYVDAADVDAGDAEVLDLQAPAYASLRAPVIRQVLRDVSLYSRTGDCGQSMVGVSNIRLMYEEHPDRHLPRLTGADMRGVNGEGRIPVARYEYGARSRTPGQIEYDPSWTRIPSAALPADMRPNFIDVEYITRDATTGATLPSASAVDDTSLQRAYYVTTALGLVGQKASIEKTWSAFTDITGDGMPDLLYRSTSGGRMKLARNVSTGSGIAFAPSVDLFAHGNFDISSAASLPLGMRLTADIIDADKLASTSFEYIRLMDFNGDGRLDIVDARRGDHWVVYINSPSDYGINPSHPEYAPNAAHPIYWMKTKVEITGLAAARTAETDLDGNLHTLDNGWVGAGRFPISWTISGISVAKAAGYAFDGNKFVCQPGFGSEYAMVHSDCAWERREDMDITWSETDASRSYVLQDVRDVNGDSYPDLVSASLSTGTDLVPGWQGADLELELELRDEDCRLLNPEGPNGGTQVCRADKLVAPNSHPKDRDWLYEGYSSIPDLSDVVVSKLSSAYTRMEDCWDSNALTCPQLFTSFPADPSAMYCWRWYGPLEECAVEDKGRHYRGYRRGLIELGNRSLSVRYNIAGVRLGPQSLSGGTAFAANAVTLHNSGGCPAIEHWVSEGDESGDMTVNESTSRLACGLAEANADGIPDRVKRIFSDDGSTSWKRTYLGTGDGFTDTVIGNPGAGTTVNRRPVCDLPGRRHPGYVGDPGSAPDPVSPGVHRYASGMDLDGDGEPDGAASGHFAFKGSFESDTPDCDDPVIYTEMLVDVNGDGRPDKARINAGRLEIREPVLLDAAGAVLDAGLLQAGKIVRATDGYGAGNEYRYANAKADEWGGHRVPFSEVVLESVTPVGGLGTATEKREQPILFAYGANSMWYDSYLERFVPTGYLESVTLRGQKMTTGDAARRSTAQVELTLRRGDAGLADRRHVVIGTVSQVRNYEGYFEDARDLLRQYRTKDWHDSWTLYTGNSSNWTDGETFFPESASVPAAFRTAHCNRVDFPYGGLDAASAPAATRECSARVLKVFRTHTEWEGSRYKARDYDVADIHGLDDTHRRHVRRQVYVTEWDSRGRAKRIKDFGDTYTSADDVCTRISYAHGQSSDFWADKEYQPLDKVFQVSTDDCNGVTLRTHTTYYIDQPGGYGSGYGMLPRVEKVSTTYRTDSGMKALPPAVNSYNDYGQLTGSSATNQSPLPGVPQVSRTMSLEYDPFSLVLMRTTTQASDVPDYTAETRYAYEPGTYRLLGVTDGNQSVTRHFDYDAMGREVSVSVSSPAYAGGAPQIVMATEYLGDDAASHLDRIVRTRGFDTWRALASHVPGSVAQEGEQRSDLRYDAFGRPARALKYMGGDYSPAGVKLSTWGVGYDTLGRVNYVTAPYQDGAHGGEPVRTIMNTIFRMEPQCDVTAPNVRNNPQRRIRAFDRESVDGAYGRRYNLPVTDEALDQVASCRIIGYQNGKRQVLTVDPASLSIPEGEAETLVGSTMEELDVHGRLLEQRVWDISGTKPAQQMRWDYDRYGRLESLSRYRAPDVSSPGELVRWYYTFDGLDRLVTFHHNLATAVGGLAPVRYQYDDWNQLVYTSNGNLSDEEGIITASGEIGRLYDGFGRLTRVRALDEESYIGNPGWHPNGEEIRYSYHPSGTNGAGQLAFVGRLSSRIQSNTYDEFGRLTVERLTRGSHVAEVERRFEGFGRLLQQITRSSDTGMQDEVQQYRYDSAGRVRGVDYGLAPVSLPLLSVDQMDLFGRPVRLTRGDGSAVDYGYQEGGRRRLLSVRETLPGNALTAGTVRRTLFEEHDPIGRIEKVRSELLKPVPGGEQVVQGIQQQFEYDYLDQLTTFKQHELPSGELVRFERYRYDGLGNLAFTHVDGDSDRRYVPRLVDRDRLCHVEVGSFATTAPLPTPRDTSCTVVYDGRGNVKQYVDPLNAQTRKLAYNGFNEIVRVDYSSTGYVGQGYGVDGGVDTRNVAGTQLLTVGPMQQRFGDAGVIWESPLAGGASRRGAPGPSSMYFKGYGSNAADTAKNSVGSERALRAYGPWGETTEMNEPERTAAGMERWHGVDVCAGSNGATSCNLTRLYQMGPRMYDAGLGRFLQRDPLVIPRSAARVNPYHYAWNNPVSYSDPSGNDPMLWIRKTFGGSNSASGGGGGGVWGNLLTNVGISVARGVAENWEVNALNARLANERRAAIPDWTVWDEMGAQARLFASSWQEAHDEARSHWRPGGSFIGKLGTAPYELLNQAGGATFGALGAISQAQNAIDTAACGSRGCIALNLQAAGLHGRAASVAYRGINVGSGWLGAVGAAARRPVNWQAAGTATGYAVGTFKFAVAETPAEYADAAWAMAGPLKLIKSPLVSDVVGGVLGYAACATKNGGGPHCTVDAAWAATGTGLKGLARAQTIHPRSRIPHPGNADRETKIGMTFDIGAEVWGQVGDPLMPGGEEDR